MDCKRFGKWVNGCKFEARYDEGDVPDRHMKARGCDAERFIYAMKPRTYVRDVCVRCGRVIERS